MPPKLQKNQYKIPINQYKILKKNLLNNNKFNYLQNLIKDKDKLIFSMKQINNATGYSTPNQIWQNILNNININNYNNYFLQILQNFNSNLSKKYLKINLGLNSIHFIKQPQKNKFLFIFINQNNKITATEYLFLQQFFSYKKQKKQPPLKLLSIQIQQKQFVLKSPQITIPQYQIKKENANFNPQDKENLLQNINKISEFTENKTIIIKRIKNHLTNNQKQ
jgi:hypothetical protein